MGNNKKDVKKPAPAVKEIDKDPPTGADEINKNDGEFGEGADFPAKDPQAGGVITDPAHIF